MWGMVVKLSCGTTWPHVGERNSNAGLEETSIRNEENTFEILSLMLNKEVE